MFDFFWKIAAHCAGRIWHTSLVRFVFVCWPVAEAWCLSQRSEGQTWRNCSGGESVQRNQQKDRAKWIKRSSCHSDHSCLVVYSLSLLIHSCPHPPRPHPRTRPRPRWLARQDPQRPVEIRVWFLRGALDKEIGMIRALKARRFGLQDRKGVEHRSAKNSRFMAVK